MTWFTKEVIYCQQIDSSRDTTYVLETAYSEDKVALYEQLYESIEADCDMLVSVSPSLITGDVTDDSYDLPAGWWFDNYPAFATAGKAII